MTEEILGILKDHLTIGLTDDEIIEAFEIATNEGYSDGEYSNNPQELIAFITGYIIGKEMFVVNNM
jgi:hypothetical protein